MSVELFQASVPEAPLDDLRERLATTRWPERIEGPDGPLGLDRDRLQSVCEHWRERFDWRQAEARLNAFPQFKAIVEGTGLHLVHAPSPRADATPLLLANGWPSSIFEYLDIIPLLTDAGFHVVAPALPGFGFSDHPTAPGMNPGRIAGLYCELMTELGYDRFLFHGSDLGVGVAEGVRRQQPERLLGLHFSNVYWGYPRPDNPSEEERAYLDRVPGWQMAEGAYAMMHATKPQTLSYSLNDSPAGLAGWIVEKFQSWTDGDFETVYGLDGICANLTLYWVTETIGSSTRLYFEAASDRATQRPPEKGVVPAGVMVLPKDILPAPRAWGERWLNLLHWTEAPRGGHFPAWEIPDLLAQDLVAFRETLR